MLPRPLLTIAERREEKKPQKAQKTTLTFTKTYRNRSLSFRPYSSLISSSFTCKDERVEILFRINGSTYIGKTKHDIIVDEIDKVRRQVAWQQQYSLICVARHLYVVQRVVVKTQRGHRVELILEEVLCSLSGSCIVIARKTSLAAFGTVYIVDSLLILQEIPIPNVITTVWCFEKINSFLNVLRLFIDEFLVKFSFFFGTI